MTEKRRTYPYRVRIGNVSPAFLWVATFDPDHLDWTTFCVNENRAARFQSIALSRVAAEAAYECLRHGFARSVDILKGRKVVECC